ncbi:MAG TPA: DotU family type IV/VI secretion system protein [Terriglobia bacterium]|nr:DotU family type IV/VI secretion system protein [Terriglobia bacterium]
MGTPPSRSVQAEPAPRRSDNLALVFQELFTVIVRLRSNRQAVADAEAFRNAMRGALKRAEQDALTRGYNSDDVRLAAFALVAFLDESVLNSRKPVFEDWSRKPMQEELFGGHMAGEVFFQTLERLLGRRDSRELADLLEVFELCLLLGFKGRYSISGPEALRGIRDAVAEKIGRIRGPLGRLSPGWAPDPVAPRYTDPWIRRLLFAGVACLVLAVVLFVGFKFSLSSGISELREISTHAGR